MGLLTDVDYVTDLKFMGLETELRRKDITPEELMEMYKPLAEEEKRFEDIEERTRAERIKRYGEYDPNNKCYCDDKLVLEIAEIWQKECKYGGKAADNQMKCELIADKYKKLTGRDIKEDLENEWWRERIDSYGIYSKSRGFGNPWKRD